MNQKISNLSASEAECSVNYIWLCRKECRSDSPYYPTRLPLHNFERMYENAEKYPFAEFNLWLDFRQLTPTDHFFLSSHRHAFDAHNIQVRNLCDVVMYKQLAGFDPDTNIALYARADCARVLVLDQLLKERPNLRAVYSDLDCQDVCLSDPLVTEALNQYGLVYGHSGGHPICNGYIALFGSRGVGFMGSNLMPITLKAFQKNLVNHFGAFSEATKNFRKSYPEKIRLGLVSLPLMRTTMPYDPSTYGRVCPNPGLRVPGSCDIV